MPKHSKHPFGATKYGLKGGKAMHSLPGSIKSPMADRVMGGKK